MQKIKSKVPEDLKKVRDEIQKLKPNFYEKKKLKEVKFTSGEEINKEIDKYYDEVREIEEKFHLKEINDKLDKKLEIKKSLEEEFIKIEKEYIDFDKSKLTKSKKVTIDSFDQKKTLTKIKNLELKLQISVLSLGEEEKINNEINDLKSKLVSKESVLNQIDLDFQKLKKEYLKLKRKLEKVNWKIRKIYKKIRLVLKEKKNKYQIIDELREKKKNVFGEFRSIKKEYLKLFLELKKLFDLEETLMKKHNIEVVKTSKRLKTDMIKKRKKLEDDFFQKGKTLTAEDLLLFQG